MDKSKDGFDADRRSSKGRFLPYERAERRARRFRPVDRFALYRRIDLGQNKKSLQDKKLSCSRDSTYPKLSEYNFNVSVVELVSVMVNIKEAMFPRSMRSDPSQRDPNLWCEYHGTNGHLTGDCRHMRNEVAILLKNGHLREFLSDRDKNNYSRSWDNAEPSKIGEDPPRQTINMIFGGNEINGVTFLAAKKIKVSVTPNFKIKRILVDPESSANIIQLRVLEQAKLTENIISVTKLLDGFNLASVTTRGEILLPTNVEGVMKTTLFEVVDDDIGYYIIPGRPWLHEMKVVPSTYHQLLKIPTPKGIKQIIGDQPVEREMNAFSVSSIKGKEHATSQLQEPTHAPEPNEDDKGEELSESHQVPRYFQVQE
nr:uncharacterized protein LOC104097195 [Nicotiana tomentosiformis]